MSATRIAPWLYVDGTSIELSQQEHSTGGWNRPATHKSSDSLRASSAHLEQQQTARAIHASVFNNHSEETSSIEPISEVTHYPRVDAPQGVISLDELEIRRRPASQAASQSLVANTWRNPPINKWRVLSACMSGFGQGFNDSAPGALLPYVEQYYGIDYAVVSTIFVANAVGFIGAAFVVHRLDHWLGRAKTLMLCEAFNAVAYGVMIVPPPFAVFAIGYFVTGFSLATALALNNVFCANTEPATTVLGAYHGSYGIGGTVAPLIATAMVNTGVEFSRFFSLLLGIRVVVGVCTATSFWNWTSEVSYASDSGQNAESSSTGPNVDTATMTTTQHSSTRPPTLIPALRKKVTLVGALFIFAYQGAEVSISGWVISFLITVRHGDPSRVGNVTAGFWG